MNVGPELPAKLSEPHHGAAEVLVELAVG